MEIEKHYIQQKYELETSPKIVFFQQLSYVLHQEKNEVVIDWPVRVNMHLKVGLRFFKVVTQSFNR